MLGDKQSIATLAVKDLKAATRFYEDKLGFVPVDREGDEVVTYRSGPSVFNVYHSKYAGTNKATALTFDVDDIDKEVGELKEKGIFFEQYDLPGLQRQGDCYDGEGGFKTTWFKDPDGNILSLMEEGD